MLYFFKKIKHIAIQRNVSEVCVVWLSIIWIQCFQIIGKLYSVFPSFSLSILFLSPLYLFPFSLSPSPLSPSSLSLLSLSPSSLAISLSLPLSLFLCLSPCLSLPLYLSLCLSFSDWVSIIEEGILYLSPSLSLSLSVTESGEIKHLFS